MDIGQRIIALRERKSWTTNRLANLCGLSQSFLRSVEIGEKGISVENLQLICDALGISLKDFFDFPTEKITMDDHLFHKINRLTPRQKSALLALLDTFEG